MPVYFDKRKKRWRYTFRRRIDGNRYQLTKLLPDGWSRTQAESYERKESSRLYAEATGVSTPRLPLAGAVKLYLDHRIPTLKNGKKAAQDLAHLVDLIESSTLDQLPTLATNYEKDHRETLAPATIRNRLSYLKAAVRFAYRVHHYGDRDYTDRMVLPVPDNQRHFYSPLPELKRLWRAMKDPEARALFRLSFYMGLRWRAELLPRQPEDVIRAQGSTWLTLGETKNGLPVMKPVHPDAIKDLQHLPFEHSDTWFYERWRIAAEAIGRPELKPHDQRHSLASEIRARGGTLEDVQGALGQKSRQSAERYAHLYPTRLQGVIMGIGKKSVQP